MPWEASYVGGGVRRRGVHSPAEGARRRGAAVGSRRMPWEASYVGGGGVPEGCRCWKPPHALGGLLCGRRVRRRGVP